MNDLALVHRFIKVQQNPKGMVMRNLTAALVAGVSIYCGSQAHSQPGQW
jgi:hypothetical protein